MCLARGFFIMMVGKIKNFTITLHFIFRKMRCIKEMPKVLTTVKLICTFLNMLLFDIEGNITYNLIM